jgi:hypothetical protein
LGIPVGVEATDMPFVSRCGFLNERTPVENCAVQRSAFIAEILGPGCAQIPTHRGLLLRNRLFTEIKHGLGIAHLSAPKLKASFNFVQTKEREKPDDPGYGAEKQFGSGGGG